MDNLPDLEFTSIPDIKYKNKSVMNTKKKKDTNKNNMCEKEKHIDSFLRQNSRKNTSHENNEYICKLKNIYIYIWATEAKHPKNLA